MMTIQYICFPWDVAGKTDILQLSVTRVTPTLVPLQCDAYLIYSCVNMHNGVGIVLELLHPLLY